ncbi:M23 family metallopeptidase [Halopiger goleimassiliensis]|uniref:M23 family metallopeptidase n=1 Tax=Halopiger goleimassiliensis TaxID=1293048 RepID=UPI0006779E28|nr:M23 family metallopeptidase [Halopiger goleimassiliensis]
MSRDDIPRGASGDSGTESAATRLRQLLRNLDPGRFGLLGFLSVPGYLVESLSVLQPLVLFFLLLLWPLVEPLFDYALKRGADEETEPTDWIHMGDPREWAVSYLSIPLAFVNPPVLVQDVLQLLGSGVAMVRHRGSVPDPSDERPITYRLPVEGTWTVVNGSLEKEYSHSWIPTTQRYAYDLVVTDEDGHSRPAGTKPAVEEYYCYDEPVLAPADGVVVDVLDTDLEPSRGGGFAHPLKRSIPGNYVTIQHAPEEFSTLAHLVPGSVAVQPGERVERGQQVGRCGHSGNSTEPHLHLQFQDHPTFELAAGIPPRFANVDVESPWLDAADGDPDSSGPTAITAGQRVTTVDSARGASDQSSSAAASTRQESPETTGDASESTRAPDEPTAATDGAGRSGATGSADGPLRSPVAVTLERFAFGVGVAAVTAVLVGIVARVAGLEVGALETALVLAGGAGAGLGWRLLAGRAGRMLRPGGFGAPLGVVAVSLLWAAVPAARWPAALLTVGVAGYVAIGALDRRLLRRAFERRASRDARAGTES